MTTDPTATNDTSPLDRRCIDTLRFDPQDTTWLDRDRFVLSGGHLQLAHLCWLYDCNRISIEGSTTITFTEDVGARFTAQGWQVLRVADANDLGALTRALQTFVDTTDRPTLIIVQSTIGYGAPHKADTKEAHGDPDATFVVWRSAWPPSSSCCGIRD